MMDPDKIEVIEFFSYACPHCNDLNPILNQWAAKLPPDVAFRKVAVGFDTPFYKLMARQFEMQLKVITTANENDQAATKLLSLT